MIDTIDKVLIINHPTYTDRRKFQEEQCTRYNLDYEIIKTVNVERANGFQNKALKSCFLSHISALKKAVNFTKPCLILEDDTYIPNIHDVNIFLDEIFNYFSNKTWDMVYMYPSRLPKNIPIMVTDNIIKNTTIINTHAYIVNPSIIQNLINKLCVYFYKLDNDYNKTQSYDLEDSHFDHVLTRYFHKNMDIYSPKKWLMFQHREIFGSTLGWGCEILGKQSSFVIEK